MFLLKKLFKMRDASHSDEVKPFLDHLEDLRWTLLKMIITLVTTMLFAFGFRKDIAALLSHPLVAVVGDIQNALITTSPIESVTMSFTLSFYTGIVVAFPILFYFLAAFILPALTLKEKRYVLPAVGVGFGLFLSGVVLCYLYVLPATLRWLHEDASAFARPSWTIREYYGFVTHLMIAVGLLCELPVVMVTLGAIGIISYEWMKSTRLYGYAAALILAGIISPTPDIFMLIVFALPIAALYELSIWLVWLMERRRARNEAKAEENPNEPID
jgi:sec-independent protein translocase protein TatC